MLTNVAGKRRGCNWGAFTLLTAMLVPEVTVGVVFSHYHKSNINEMKRNQPGSHIFPCDTNVLCCEAVFSHAVDPWSQSDSIKTIWGCMFIFSTQDSYVVELLYNQASPIKVKDFLYKWDQRIWCITTYSFMQVWNVLHNLLFLNM